MMQTLETMRDTTPHNQALALQVLEVMNQGNLALLDQIYVPDSITDDEGYLRKGVEAEKQFIAMMRRAFPDLHIVCNDVIAIDNKVVVYWQFTGTHQGQLLDLAATGKTVKVRGMSLHYFRDGKIATTYVIAQTLRLFQQLGKQ